MITVLTGANNIALRSQLLKMKKEFTDVYSSSGIEQVSGETVQKHELAGILQGVTLFSTQRLIIIKSISSQKDVATEFALQLKGIADDTSIVLVEPQLDKRTIFYKELMKVAKLLTFNEMDEREAVKWVTDTVKNSGGIISQQDASFLVQRTGPNQSRLDNEIAKLLLIDQVIKREAIVSAVEQDPKESVFELLDHALSGQRKQALHILAQLKAMKTDPHQLVGLLIWQVNIMAVVYSAKSKPDMEVVKQAKIKPFVVQKTRRLVRRLSRQSLLRIIEAVVTCDTQLKSTGTQPYQSLEVAIITISSE